MLHGHGPTPQHTRYRYADGMQSSSARPFCSFYVPKLLLVLAYVGVSAWMFLVHGRTPTSCGARIPGPQIRAS